MSNNKRKVDELGAYIDSILEFDYASNGERVELRTDGETYYDVVLQDMLMHRYKFSEENYAKAMECYNDLRNR